MNDILNRLEDRDISAWSDAYSCRARGAEAAALIRELRAEANMFELFNKFNSRRIRELETKIAALTTAPVTPAEAARNDAKVALEHIEAVEDAYTRWMLANAVGDANLIHRDSNALSHALFSMFNSDPDDGPSEVTRALRALADAGEAGE